MATASVVPAVASTNPIDIGCVNCKWEVGKIVNVQARTWAG